MKKISVILIILMIFNFIYLNVFTVPVFAEPSESEGEATFGYKAYAEQGIVSINGEETEISLTDSQVGAVGNILGSVMVNVSVVISQMISNVVINSGLYYVESEYSSEKTGLFTVNSLIFGEYLIFNAKAYEKSTDLNPDLTPSAGLEIMDSIKDKGSSLSEFLRKVVMGLSLPLILLALIKTISSEKTRDVATWKKILARWVLCLFFLIFYQYILAGIDTFSDMLMDMFWKARVNFENQGYRAFEATIIENVSKQYANAGGVLALGYAIVLTGIIVMQVLFVIKYVKRTFGILLLFMSAPIVILIHSFNLMLGKESNMLGNFFKNYMALVFMQPLHALFYLVFIFTLSEIAIVVPILGIILLFALFRAIDIAKAMFGWEIGTPLFSNK